MGNNKCTICVSLRQKDVWPPDFPHQHNGEAWSKGLAEAVENASTEATQERKEQE